MFTHRQYHASECFIYITYILLGRSLAFGTILVAYRGEKTFAFYSGLTLWLSRPDFIFPSGVLPQSESADFRPSNVVVFSPVTYVLSLSFNKKNIRTIHSDTQSFESLKQAKHIYIMGHYYSSGYHELKY